jgi:hypothetical protein
MRSDREVQLRLRGVRKDKNRAEELKIVDLV